MVGAQLWLCGCQRICYVVAVWVPLSKHRCNHNLHNVQHGCKTTEHACQCFLLPPCSLPSSPVAFHPHSHIFYRSMGNFTLTTYSDSVIQYNAMQCDTIRYDTIRYDTIRYDTIRYDRYDTIQCNTMQYKATRRNKHNTTPHNTTQRNATQRNATQRNAIQYNWFISTLIRVSNICYKPTLNL